MRIQSVSLRHVRNYEALELPVGEQVNLFLGDNGQGKTNILEALYFCAFAKSHRTSNDVEMIGWQQPQGSISLLFSRKEVSHRLDFVLSRPESKRSGKKVQINGQPAKARDVVGLFNAVLFAPEDLLLVKGAPQLRRRFLDGELSQSSPLYYKNLLQYHRVLLQRNQLLRSCRERTADEAMLAAWDAQLAPLAAWLVFRRQEAVKKLSMLANLMQRRITDGKEELAVRYQLQGVAKGLECPNAAWYLEQLEAGRRQDIFRGSTGIGPHRDDLEFLVNDTDLKAYGSQGQQRTGVLALKLAELEFIKAETGEYPVLLLDDVMSELDAGRREHLLTFIRERIQTFITGTEAAYFPSRLQDECYRVRQGQVERRGTCSL